MLMPILGVGWILGLFAVNKATVVFEYAFALVNGFQVRIDINFFYQPTQPPILFFPVFYPRMHMPMQKLSQHEGSMGYRKLT